MSQCGWLIEKPPYLIGSRVKGIGEVIRFSFPVKKVQYKVGNSLFWAGEGLLVVCTNSSLGKAFHATKARESLFLRKRAEHFFSFSLQHFLLGRNIIHKTGRGYNRGQIQHLQLPACSNPPEERLSSRIIKIFSCGQENLRIPHIKLKPIHLEPNDSYNIYRYTKPEKQFEKF